MEILMKIKIIQDETLIYYIGVFILKMIVWKTYYHQGFIYYINPCYHVNLHKSVFLKRKNVLPLLKMSVSSGEGSHAPQTLPQ